MMRPAQLIHVMRLLVSPTYRRHQNLRHFLPFLRLDLVTLGRPSDYRLTLDDLRTLRLTRTLP